MGGIRIWARRRCCEPRQRGEVPEWGGDGSEMPNGSYAGVNMVVVVVEAVTVCSISPGLSEVSTVCPPRGSMQRRDGGAPGLA